jgi:hypothetical protein
LSRESSQTENRALQRRSTTLGLRLRKTAKHDLELRKQSRRKMIYPIKSLPQNSSTPSGRACSTQYKVAAARDLSLFVEAVEKRFLQ